MRNDDEDEDEKTPAAPKDGGPSAMLIQKKFLEQRKIFLWGAVEDASARDIVEECGVPRFLFVDFPLGNPCGKPWDAEMQRRIVGGALHAKRVGVAVQVIDHAVGERLDGFAIVQRPTDDFVVNVGDIAHISHRIATGLEPALHHIKGEHGAGVAQVAIVIHRHAADIHAHAAGLDRGEVLQSPRQRIMKSQTHGNLFRLSLTWHYPSATGPLRGEHSAGHA